MPSPLSFCYFKIYLLPRLHLGNLGFAYSCKNNCSFYVNVACCKWEWGTSSTNRLLCESSNHYLLLCGQAAITVQDQVSSLWQKQHCSRTKGEFQLEENGATANGPSSTLLCFMSTYKPFSWCKINHGQEWLFKHSKFKSVSLPLYKSILGNSNL